MLLDLADGKRPQAKENLMSGCHTENQISFLNVEKLYLFKGVGSGSQDWGKKRGRQIPFGVFV